MKPQAVLVLTLAFGAAPVQAMKMAEPNGAATEPTSASPVSAAPQHAGKIEAVHAAASKIVIKGETYAYSPLTTVVTIDGKRATMSDVRIGDAAQFQASSQGANKPSLLTSITIQRP